MGDIRRTRAIALMSFVLAPLALVSMLRMWFGWTRMSSCCWSRSHISRTVSSLRWRMARRAGPCCRGRGLAMPRRIRRDQA